LGQIRENSLVTTIVVTVVLMRGKTELVVGSAGLNCVVLELG
jgi:hypothetical protein